MVKARRLMLMVFGGVLEEQSDAAQRLDLHQVRVVDDRCERVRKLILTVRKKRSIFPFAAPSRTGLWHRRQPIRW
jgi:hypothetical protein